MFFCLDGGPRYPSFSALHRLSAYLDRAFVHSSPFTVTNIGEEVTSHAIPVTKASLPKWTDALSNDKAEMLSHNAIPMVKG